jgi:hypothetical protein
MPTKSIRVGTTLIVAVTAVLASPFIGRVLAADEKIAVTAKKLAEDYATDPAAYNKKYKDKIVEVEGVVFLPDAKNKADEPGFVLLEGFHKKGDPVSTSVRFLVTDAFKGLKKGDKIKVKGKAQAHSDTVFGATLEDCALIEKK